WPRTDRRLRARAPRLRDRAAVSDLRRAAHRHRPPQGGRTLVRPRRRARPRPRHDPRPARRGCPPWAPLRHAGDAAIRRTADAPRPDGLLHRPRRARDAGGDGRGRSGDLRLMSDLRDLYQQVILDHNRKPRNFRKVAAANRTAEGYNPLCGDRITLELTV